MNIDPHTARMVIRWRLMSMLVWYGEDDKIREALDGAVKVLDSAIATEVEVKQPKKEVN